MIRNNRENSPEVAKARQAALFNAIGDNNIKNHNGVMILDVNSLPETEDPEAPDTKSMEEKTMEALHSAIERKKEEYKEEMKILEEQSKINERIAKEKGIDIGNEDEVNNMEFSEDEDLEAQLDMEIAMEESGAGRLNVERPDIQLEDVDDSVFESLISNFDNKYGK